MSPIDIITTLYCSSVGCIRETNEVNVATTISNTFQKISKPATSMRSIRYPGTAASYPGFA